MTKDQNTLKTVSREELLKRLRNMKGFYIIELYVYLPYLTC